VELGYATTAHRAQGRTVDTAHAFVSVTTQREVLYVAATRGRESNRLYVDTMYDPDADTQHGLPAERDAGDVLRQVLEARGADLSATETIAADWAEQHGIVRVWAEYDTIAGVAQRERYDELVMSSCAGAAPEQVQGLQDSAAYGPLLAALREAEAFGLDVEQGLPRLVNGRTLSSSGRRRGCSSWPGGQVDPDFGFATAGGCGPDRWTVSQAGRGDRPGPGSRPRGPAGAHRPAGSRDGDGCDREPPAVGGAARIAAVRSVSA